MDAVSRRPPLSLQPGRLRAPQPFLPGHWLLPRNTSNLDYVHRLTFELRHYYGFHEHRSDLSIGHIDKFSLIYQTTSDFAGHWTKHFVFFFFFFSKNRQLSRMPIDAMSEIKSIQFEYPHGVWNVLSDDVRGNIGLPLSCKTSIATRVFFESSDSEC